MSPASTALIVALVSALQFPPRAHPTHEAYLAHATGPAHASAPALDYETFRSRIQPIFLNHRAGHARCYACHSQGTAFRLEPLAPGRTSWSDEASRRNFEAVQRVVTPGNPLASRLLLMPLATEAGGTGFHPGGKHWSSQDDPEWQILAAWVRGTTPPEGRRP